MEGWRGAGYTGVNHWKLLNLEENNPISEDQPENRNPVNVAAGWDFWRRWLHVARLCSCTHGPRATKVEYASMVILCELWVFVALSLLYGLQGYGKRDVVFSSSHHSRSVYISGPALS